MTAPARHPILTAERAYHVDACCAWIDRTLYGDEALLPGYAAQHALALLTNIGIAEATVSPEMVRITIYGITGTSVRSVSGALRDWQDRAKDRLQAGVQR
jgi:hypothetical protein